MTTSPCPPGESAVDLVRKLRAANSIPALDENVAQLCRLTERSETRTTDLTAVIMRDAALTSRLLAIANSAAYRPRNPIKTVSSAVILLGFDRIRQLAFGLSLFHKHAETIRDKELYRLLVCAYCSGLFAMALARRLRDETPEELFVGGLMHQLPRLVLFNAFPESYREMARAIVHERLDRDRACVQAFGAGYDAIAMALADHWQLPEPCRFYVAESGERTAPRRQAVHLAVAMADLVFGNSPPGPETAGALIARAVSLTNESEFSLPNFAAAAADADPNMESFFHLSGQDVAMMARIAEWGKVDSADVANTLTHSFERREADAVETDTPLVMAHFLSELMIATRNRSGINAVLMLAQEGIYRCMRPTCVLTAFADRRQNRLQGRLIAGEAATIEPARYQAPLDADDCLAIQNLQGSEVVLASAARQRILPDDALFRELNLDNLLLAPIRSKDRTIGQFLLGRRTGEPPFSADDCLWMIAIAGHVAMAFEATDE